MSVQERQSFPWVAMINACENGYQSAIMAPTEILAVQHYRKLKKWSEKSA